MTLMKDEFDKAHAASDALRERTKYRPSLGLILGSGLGVYADRFEDRVEVPYEEIPHFPKSTVAGHAGQLVFGRIHGRKVVAMQGRVHAYEGHSAAAVAFPVRVLHALGVRTLLLTNAAGGIGSELTPGSLVCIDDHLNLTGDNPLRGVNDASRGPRFPDMSALWTPSIRALADDVAAAQGITLFHGVYAGVLGPNYETPAEVRMLRGMGATVVGMSTVHEAIAAAHLGMKLGGVSCVTNLAAGLEDSVLDHDDVQAVAASVRDMFARLIDGIVAGLPPEPQEVS